MSGHALRRQPIGRLLPDGATRQIVSKSDLFASVLPAGGQSLYRIREAFNGVNCNEIRDSRNDSRRTKIRDGALAFDNHFADMSSHGNDYEEQQQQWHRPTSSLQRPSFTSRFGITASVHQRPLMIAPAAVWCNA